MAATSARPGAAQVHDRNPRTWVDEKVEKQEFQGTSKNMIKKPTPGSRLSRRLKGNNKQGSERGSGGDKGQI